MRKFNNLYKEKQVVVNKLHEKKVLRGFKKIYATLLEQYNVVNVNQLTNANKKAFITELNEYWAEKNGITKRGRLFLKDNHLLLTENSTIKQKRYFLIEKLDVLIDETLRKSQLKHKLYDVLDEMYKETKSEDIEDVLKSKTITKTIAESFSKSVGKLLAEIDYEITDEE